MIGNEIGIIRAQCSSLSNWSIPGACIPRIERYKRLTHKIASDVSLASVVAALAA